MRSMMICISSGQKTENRKKEGVTDMSKKTRIDYDRAEEDLWDQSDSEEPWGIRDYRNER